MIETWQRHDLLRIDPSGWRCALDARADLVSLELLSGWVDQGWPVMVRRYLASDVPDRIPIAVALPRAISHPGVALQVRQQDVLARRAQLLLSEAADGAPAHWRAALRQLVAIGERLGAVPAVYGSLLWQWLTGLPYLRERSDLDLIWRVTHFAQAQQLAQQIDACAADSPMPIDGEFILPDDSAVNWREFHSHAPQVLVKTLRGVESTARQRLFGRGLELERRA